VTDVDGAELIDAHISEALQCHKREGDQSCRLLRHRGRRGAAPPGARRRRRDFDVITRRTIASLALSQLVCWGVTYYLVGAFGEDIAAELGWGRDVVHGGFSLALLVMGLVSSKVGRLIDQRGGRTVMTVGSILNAAGCVVLASSHTLASYFIAWACLGLGMRLSLYDAAFAALARIGGPEARRPISYITLVGGLSSTAFWPIGHLLAEHLGWRGAVFTYAGFALLTIPLHLAIPTSRHERPVEPGGQPPERSAVLAKGRLRAVLGLYALVVALTNFLNAGMSAHIIAILSGFGLAAALSVQVATLRGVGQSLARLCEILFGRNINPVALNLFACVLMPLAFITGLFSGVSTPAAVAFAFLVGAGNGLLTVARGTLPLVLFDPRSYGTIVGRLIAPSFILGAAAPIVFATVINHFGETGALGLSAICAGVMLVASVVLLLLRRGSSGQHRQG
jgi:MFS family permease